MIQSHGEMSIIKGRIDIAPTQYEPRIGLSRAKNSDSLRHMVKISSFLLAAEISGDPCAFSPAIASIINAR
jgi:hypothetical protein